MDIDISELITAVVGVVVATSSALAVYVRLSIGAALGKIEARLAAIEVKVDTMWTFQMRRAISEVVEKGLGTLNSPLTFESSVVDRLAPIKDRLIKFSQSRQSLSDGELLLAIEKEFGNELLNLICVPCGMSHGACLLLALSVARQNNALTLSL